MEKYPTQSPIQSPTQNNEMQNDNILGFNLELLKIIVCPVSKSALHYDADAQELICKISNLAYPIRNGIPVLIKEEAREIK